MTGQRSLRRRVLGFGRLREVSHAQDGIAATEFGLISPVLFVMLFGAFDISHTLYMKSLLEGAVQKASRDATLQTASGTDATVRAAIDDAVRDQLTPLNQNATITFKRRFYRTFTEAAAADGEEIIDDANDNGDCDSGESFLDANHNGNWDRDGGDDVARAGARDNVVYTVTVEYPDVFPISAFIGGDPTTRLQATTVLANQPYGDQASYDAPVPVDCS